MAEPVVTLLSHTSFHCIYNLLLVSQALSHAGAGPAPCPTFNGTCIDPTTGRNLTTSMDLCTNSTGYCAATNVDALCTASCGGACLPTNSNYLQCSENHSFIQQTLLDCIDHKFKLDSATSWCWSTDQLIAYPSLRAALRMRSRCGTVHSVTVLSCTPTSQLQ